MPPKKRTAKPPFGFTAVDVEYAGTYEGTWDYSISHPKDTWRGKTGWVKILQSTNPAYSVGHALRVHVCAHNPCQADWEPSKYGASGVPMHIAIYVPSSIAYAAPTPPALCATVVAKPAITEAVVVATAVAEPSVATPALAEPASSSSSSASSSSSSSDAGPAVAPIAPSIEQPLPPAAEAAADAATPSASAPEPPPDIQPSPLPEATVDCGAPTLAILEQVAAPAPPAVATLLGLNPPAPSLPYIVDPCHDTIAPVVTDTPAAAACRVLRTLLALARAIREPNVWIGYSSFILLGLLKETRPFVWEGSNLIDLVDVFAPWATTHCTKQCAVEAVCCALKVQPSGHALLCPISKENPLNACKHFVACTRVADAAVADADPSATEFDQLYSSLGVVVLGTVVDGDCGIDAMTMMLSQPSSIDARKQLRIEISDYLIQRINEPWLHDLMVVCQELDADDVALMRQGNAAPHDFGGAAAEPPTAPAAAAHIAEPVGTAVAECAKPDDETFAAIQWASRLTHGAHVLNLLEALPPAVVQEQVAKYTQHKANGPSPSTVALRAQRHAGKFVVRNGTLFSTRMTICKLFHQFRRSRGLDGGGRKVRHTTTAFVKERLHFPVQSTSPRNISRYLLRWYDAWCKTASNLDAAVADDTNPHAHDMVQEDTRRGAQSKIIKLPIRKRASGGGRKVQAPLVRKALYEWWAGLRYAINWDAHISGRRSRERKCLARFPRSVLRTKCHQLLEDHAYACLLNGQKVETFITDAKWFRHWQDEHGLSMRMANRKYQVPRVVLKERLEIFWVNLFRMRLFIFLVFQYNPKLENWDQSPYHNNETGSQNKPILCVAGGKVPVVEGNSDVKTRWTANLTTFSDSERILEGKLPYCELMFKAEPDGRTDARLQAFLRNRGFPKWFTVTTAPKGSYREQDVISFLQKHLELWTVGRDWRIIFADDYSAHKTDNVRNLCWSRGYVLMIHGGGATPVAQTPDTVLNEDVRREYGVIETRLLIDKMRDGVVVPKATPEECMLIMLEVLSNPDIHLKAASGYLQTGESVDLFGDQDKEICKEAGIFWNEKTTDGFLTMRQKINVELAAVAEEYETGGLTWCRRDVERLIDPYPPRKKVDAVLAALGEDFYHDAVHTNFVEADDECHVPAADIGSSDDDGEPGEPTGAAVADGDIANDADDEAAVADDARCAFDDADHTDVAIPLTAEQADVVHGMKSQMAQLQESIAGLRAVGAISSMQGLELDLAKLMRRERELIRGSPAVADAFLHRRRAETRELIRRKQFAAEQNDREAAAKKAKSECDTLAAELKRHKQLLLEYENLRETKHAMKTYTVDALGKGSKNAGGAKGRDKRCEVLDRLARIGSGLSPGQKNDFVWFKDAWNTAMVEEHKELWAETFAQWMQVVLHAENSNAFSVFVYNETKRNFHSSAALHVP